MARTLSLTENELAKHNLVHHIDNGGRELASHPTGENTSDSDDYSSPFLAGGISYRHDVDWADLWETLGAEPDLDQLSITGVGTRRSCNKESREDFEPRSCPSDDAGEFLTKPTFRTATTSSSSSWNSHTQDSILTKFLSSTSPGRGPSYTYTESDTSQGDDFDARSETFCDDMGTASSPSVNNFEKSPKRSRKRISQRDMMEVRHALIHKSLSCSSNRIARSTPSSPLRTFPAIFSSGMHLRHASDPDSASSPKRRDEVLDMRPKVFWGSTIAMESELRSSRRRFSQMKSVITQHAI